MSSRTGASHVTTGLVDDPGCLLTPGIAGFISPPVVLESQNLSRKVQLVALSRVWPAEPF